MSNLSFKSIAVAAALAVGALALSHQPAEAGRNKTGAIIAGIAIGALIAGAASHNHRRHHYYPKAHYYAPPPPRRHYVPPPVYHRPPPPPPVAYGYRPAPWTPEWYDYCSQRYRSFDPVSGTFQPYRGPRRLCR